MPSARTGTPRASATAGSTEANTSGRAMTARVSDDRGGEAAEDHAAGPAEIASRLPNSTDVVVLGVGAGQRGEQHAERGRQREDRAGGHLPVGHPPAEQADQQAAADAEHGQARG